jgi:hypothetical protein
MSFLSTIYGGVLAHKFIAGGLGLVIALVAGYYYSPYPYPEIHTKFSPVLSRLLSSYSGTRSYDDVCWLTSHNSFTYKNPLSEKQFFPNQSLTIKEQLEHGVRGFMIDLHRDTGGNIVIAHGSALLFKQQLLPFLNTIKDWLDSNKDDIITVHLESYVGNYTDIMTLINTAGLQVYLFDLGSSTSWPTLGSMRASDKRLIIFSDNRLDLGTGIMHATKYMETQYDLASYPCCDMRTDGRTIPPPNAPLFVMNHFYPILITPRTGIWSSYFSASSDVNSYKRLEKRICDCFSKGPPFGKWPNFIAVDFAGTFGGEELEIVLDINNKSMACSASVTCP